MTKNENDNNSSEHEVAIKQREGSIVRRIVFITLSTLVVLLLIGIGSGYFYIKSALKPVDANSDEEIELEIPLGSSSSEIASTLENKGLIKNSKVFTYYLKFKNKPDFQAGEYTLSPSLTPEKIIEKLQSGKVMEEPKYRITIPEGKMADQIAEITAHQFDFSTEEFLDVLNDEETIDQLQETYPELITDELKNDDLLIPLEGYLYAGTYEIFEEEPEIETIIDMMVDQTNSIMQSKIEETEHTDLSIHEILTLASVIERESKFSEDRPKVSQVFLNRLDKEMKLQSDITAAYANGEHKVLMNYDDIETNSPYNTYVTEDLPPGPISSPSLDSIDAVLSPEGDDFDNLYFYARPDGETFYSHSLEEHEVIKEEYEHEWHELEEEQKNAKSSKK